MRELERDSADTLTVLPALALVGAGRLGGALARAATANGLRSSLAGRGEIAPVCGTAEVALLCVPDEAIEEACAEVAECVPPVRFVGHTSGVTGLDSLAAAGDRGAETFSLHPLQTVPDPETSLESAPCAISGSSPGALELATRLALALGMRPFELSEDRRDAYHAAASIASNFLVTLEESAAGLLDAAGLEDARALLAPLVLRTASNWAERGPAALTGPIARGDEATVDRHLRALRETAPELLSLYGALCERTRVLASRQVASQQGKAAGQGLRRVASKADLREALAGPRRKGLRIGLVPTMGAFHEGHLSLMRAARGECDVVVVSLFVNPAQFGPAEDLSRYPGDPNRDAALAESEGVDLLYEPAVAEVYPEGFATSVEVQGLTDVLCGAPESRGSEHFRGVTTVVAKLLQTVQPDIAYFGQKDAQQALVIRRMAADLDFATEIRALPTVREPDGLAMSSRNAYLTPEDRERARALHRALLAAESVAASGTATVDEVRAAAAAELEEAGVETEYLEVRDAERLSPAESLNGLPVLVAVAATIGAARLIDNTIIDPARSRDRGGRAKEAIAT